ncbi:MAG: glycoside hydrolase family 125 protein [bacterium]|nr:glycoside hydrolase family 125 protein [bacterium]
MPVYQITGNEYLSLPAIRESDGAVESISFLYMQLKGMLEVTGTPALIAPYIQCGAKRLPLNPVWERQHCWIPSFTSVSDGFSFRCTYLSPVGERGFGMRLEAENQSATAASVAIGLDGEWTQTLHTVNESIPLASDRMVKASGWNHMFVFQQVPGLPLMAFAPIVGDDQPFSEIDQGAEWSQHDFSYDIHKTTVLQPGQRMQLDVFWGVGYEEVAASTSAKEMLRQGFDALYARACGWLSERERRSGDERIDELLNTNLFFAFFYASGRTVDTEELCMMTSRSPRYYVSAAYWDRDSLLWAFPAIVQADHAYARELLLSVFQRQGRNFGVHSRFIDGTVLEPGFELDELCAPVIALERYVAITGDPSILNNALIRDRLESILQKLRMQRHPTAALYATFLQPTDDLHRYPYLTYDNVLVWRALRCLGEWLNRSDCLAEAEAVHAAILEHCVFAHEGKRIFAWSVDLCGQWDIYDEPPGSLQLLPFYGFCPMEDEVWRNTTALIRSPSYGLSFANHPIAEIGCKHAPHPWVLSMCNSLISGHAQEALDHLRLTTMDNGVACESVHEDTGVCTTGAAFATCAGFLAFALLEALASC